MTNEKLATVADAVAATGATTDLPSNKCITVDDMYAIINNRDERIITGEYYSKLFMDMYSENEIGWLIVTYMGAAEIIINDDFILKMNESSIISFAPKDPYSIKWEQIIDAELSPIMTYYYYCEFWHWVSGTGYTPGGFEITELLDAEVIDKQTAQCVIPKPSNLEFEGFNIRRVTLLFIYENLLNSTIKRPN